MDDIVRDGRFIWDLGFFWSVFRVGLTGVCVCGTTGYALLYHMASIAASFVLLGMPDFYFILFVSQPRCKGR